MSQIYLCKLKELYKEEIIELIDCCGAVLKEVTVSRRCTELFLCAITVCQGNNSKTPVTQQIDEMFILRQGMLLYNKFPVLEVAASPLNGFSYQLCRVSE